MKLLQLLEGHPVNLEDLDEPDVEQVQHAVDSKHLDVHLYGKPLAHWISELLKSPSSVRYAYYSFDSESLYVEADMYNKQHNDYETKNFVLDRKSNPPKWGNVWPDEFDRYNHSEAVNLTKVA